MSVRVQLNPAGIAEALKSEPIKKAVEDAANAIAEGIAAQGLVAESGVDGGSPDIVGVVEIEVTDTAHATVTIQHPAGLAMQARHGVLTKAAASAGLEVRAKP